MMRRGRRGERAPRWRPSGGGDPRLEDARRRVQGSVAWRDDRAVEEPQGERRPRPVLVGQELETADDGAIGLRSLRADDRVDLEAVTGELELQSADLASVDCTDDDAGARQREIEDVTRGVVEHAPLDRFEADARSTLAGKPQGADAGDRPEEEEDVDREPAERGVRG